MHIRSFCFIGENERKKYKEHERLCFVEARESSMITYIKSVVFWVSRASLCETYMHNAFESFHY